MAKKRRTYYSSYYSRKNKRFKYEGESEGSADESEESEEEEVIEEEGNMETKEPNIQTSELYEVENLIDRSYDSDGTPWYFVKWLGYADTENTWEPITNLQSCIGLVKEFDEKMKAQYIAEEIRSKRVRRNIVEYKIKWANFPESMCTWEPEKNIIAKSLIEEFEKKELEKKKFSKRFNMSNISKQEKEKITEIKKTESLEVVLQRLNFPSQWEIIRCILPIGELRMRDIKPEIVYTISIANSSEEIQKIMNQISPTVDRHIISKKFFHKMKKIRQSHYIRRSLHMNDILFEDHLSQLILLYNNNNNNSNTTINNINNKKNDNNKSNNNNQSNNNNSTINDKHKTEVCHSFSVFLFYSKKQSKFQMELLPIKYKIASNFSRIFGSERILYVYFSDTLSTNYIIDVCEKGIELPHTGRLYEFICSFPFERKAIFLCTSIKPYLNSHQIREALIPSQLNPNLSISKYNLLISSIGSQSSLNALKNFAKKFRVDDEIATISNDDQRNILSGYSLISKKFADQICIDLKLNFNPSVFFATFNNTRGMWITDYDTKRETISLTPSQYQFNKNEITTAEMTAQPFEISSISQPSFSADISYLLQKKLLKEFNLSPSLFNQLIEEFVDSLCHSFRTPSSTLLFFQKYRKKSFDKSEIMEMIMAGFDFKEPRLRQLISHFLFQLLHQKIQLKTIPVLKSRILLVVPDFLGQLQANQVFLQISNDLLGVSSTPQVGVIVGPILIHFYTHFKRNLSNVIVDLYQSNIDSDDSDDNNNKKNKKLSRKKAIRRKKNSKLKKKKKRDKNRMEMIDEEREILKIVEAKNISQYRYLFDCIVLSKELFSQLSFDFSPFIWTSWDRRLFQSNDQNNNNINNNNFNNYNNNIDNDFLASTHTPISSSDNNSNHLSGMSIDNNIDSYIDSNLSSSFDDGNDLFSDPLFPFIPNNNCNNNNINHHANNTNNNKTNTNNNNNNNNIDDTLMIDIEEESGVVNYIKDTQDNIINFIHHSEIINDKLHNHISIDKMTTVIENFQMHYESVIENDNAKIDTKLIKRKLLFLSDTSDGKFEYSDNHFIDSDTSDHIVVSDNESKPNRKDNNIILSSKYDQPENTLKNNIIEMNDHQFDDFKNNNNNKIFASNNLLMNGYSKFQYYNNDNNNDIKNFNQPIHDISTDDNTAQDEDNTLPISSDLINLMDDSCGSLLDKQMENEKQIDMEKSDEIINFSQRSNRTLFEITHHTDRDVYIHPTLKIKGALIQYFLDEMNINLKYFQKRKRAINNINNINNNNDLNDNNNNNNNNLKNDNNKYEKELEEYYNGLDIEEYFIKRLGEWWFDASKSSESDPIAIDDDLLLSDIPVVFLDSADKMRAEFNEKFQRIFRAIDKTEEFKSLERLKLEQEIRDRFLNASVSYWQSLVLASAIYSVTRKVDINLQQGARSFPWVACADRLRRIKSDSIVNRGFVYQDRNQISLTFVPKFRNNLTNFMM